MKKIKIILFILILANLGLFVMPPANSPPVAQAEVFERFLGLANEMASYPSEQSSKPRRVMINNNTTWLQVTRTQDPIVQVLEFYEAEAQGKNGLPKSILNSTADQELKQALQQLDTMFKKLSSMGNFKLIRQNYGFLGMIELHEDAGSEIKRQRVQQLAKQGKFGELATARLVMALRDKADQETTVITLRTDKDFDLNNLTPGSSGDRPGFDIEQVPRYPAATRTFSMEQENSAGRQRLVMYKGSGSLSSNILFFHARMESEGWKPEPHFEELARRTNNQGAMFYVQQGRECMIQIQKNDDHDQLISTTIIERI